MEDRIEIEQIPEKTLPRRFAHLKIINTYGETFTGQVEKWDEQQGEKIVWIKLHGGSEMVPIAWDSKVKTWEFMNESK